MIGFIGAGNMASALIHGMIGGGVEPAELAAYDIDQKKLDSLRDLGVAVFQSLGEIASSAEVLVLAVKPKDCQTALFALDKLKWSGNLVSVVTGWPQAKLSNALSSASGVLRMMPNTPAQVREGLIAINENHSMAALQFATVQNAFSKCGVIFEISESLFDAVTSISGSGPAYVYLFMEALADAGVREGLPRQMAYTLAAQTVRGAATMVQKTGKHPGALKDDVCSPGGTTIEAIAVLEKSGLRNAVMEAVRACAKKAKRMARQDEGKSK